MKLAAVALAALVFSGSAAASGFDPIASVYGKPDKTLPQQIGSHRFICQYWLERWGFMARCVPVAAKKTGRPPA